MRHYLLIFALVSLNSHLWAADSKADEDRAIELMKKDPDFKAVYRQPKGPAFTKENKRVVFDGEVKERFGFPGYWSGFLTAWQAVRYQVVANDGKDIPEKEVIVHHVIGGPNCRSDYPALSKEVFAIGNKLHVIAERTPSGDYVCWSEKEYVTPLKSK